MREGDRGQGFNFTQTMIDNSEQIAAPINEASESGPAPSIIRSRSCRRPTHPTETTSEAVTALDQELRDTAEMATQGAAKTITRTLRELTDTTRRPWSNPSRRRPPPCPRSRTQNMLRRIRPPVRAAARGQHFLQEVLTRAHENMSEIESTLVTRVADSSRMNDVAQKTGRRTATSSATSRPSRS